MFLKKEKNVSIFCIRHIKPKLLNTFIALSCLVGGHVSSGHAQQTDFQSWTLVAATVDIDPDKKFFAYMEVQPRIGDGISRLERLLIRPALGYNLSPNLALALGYAWTPTFSNASYEGDFRNENRLWQQLQYKHDLWGLKWQHRLRQEQRIIEDASSTSYRTRYQLRGSYGLAPDNSYGLTGYNETFATENGTRRGFRGGFDRSRFFFGPYLLSGPGRYEIGYLGEYARQFGKDSRMINAIIISAQYTF
jgi:hypothetical protein